MPAELPVVIVVAGEDRGHFSMTTLLADRVVCEHVEWVADALDSVRQYLPADERPWFALKLAYELARERRLPVHGHFGGAAGLPDARSFRAQLLIWKDMVDRGTRIDAALLVRDLDNRPERRKGLEQAIGVAPWPFVVLGVYCQPEVEAWHFCGFEPEDRQERQRLEHIEREISFSPSAEPERLIATDPAAKHNAKTVLKKLLLDDHERLQRCLERPLDELRARGGRTGLADFLEQVERKLVPLFADHPRPQS